MIKHGVAPYLECSSRGDKRFSAFFARIKGRGNRSVEDIYQAAKVLPDGRTGLKWNEVKGQVAVNQPECNVLYRQLWREFMQENPELLPAIMGATGLSDMFGQPGTVCQATELWRIRIEQMESDLATAGIRGSIRVVSKRAGSTQRPDPDEIVIDVDRSNPLLGNPYPMKNESHQERHRVIQAHGVYLGTQLQSSHEMRERIARIADLVMQGKEVALQCWCAPLPCHAENIRDAAIELAWRRVMKNQPDDKASESMSSSPTSTPAQRALF